MKTENEFIDATVEMDSSASHDNVGTLVIKETAIKYTTHDEWNGMKHTNSSQVEASDFSFQNQSENKFHMHTVVD